MAGQVDAGMCGGSVEALETTERRWTHAIRDTRPRAMNAADSRQVSKEIRDSGEK